MDAALTRYIKSVRAICDEGWSMSAKVRRIREAAARLVEKPLKLSKEHRFVPKEGYGRNLIYRDPKHGFVVIAMVWPPGSGGCPHDHKTWGVVAVAEGPVRIVNYEREDDGKDRVRARLRESARIEGKPGAVGYVLPPHEDIHAISNPSGAELSISIHTYGRDIRRCKMYQLDGGDVANATLSYHNE